MDYETKLQELQVNITASVFLRNIAGAHFNEWATNVTSSEAHDFVIMIRDFTELFKCPRCEKNYVQYDSRTKALYCEKCAGKPNAPLWSTKG